ncbi:hypothetical protein [Pseudotenacibaculum haliotis]|uniref:Uncharacterized protein n=1 Tax=Pseudotenacibaculum haliotis TaxID=1862138 RepID=A0ABW5LMK9_9FLAO
MKNLQNYLALYLFIIEDQKVIDPDELFNTYNREEIEKVVLSAIKEFAEFDYDKSSKYFTRDMEGIMFATEVVELEKINSLHELHDAIDYLLRGYHKRLNLIKQSKEFSLPDKLYKAPKEVQNISRKLVLNFLKESHQIEGEKELFELGEAKHREAIYDMYRTFTGCIPREDSPGNIYFSFLEDPNLKLSYGGLPDFDNNKDLFSHIRDMRKIKEKTHQMLQETTPQRMAEIKRLAKDKQKDNQREQ